MAGRHLFYGMALLALSAGASAMMAPASASAKSAGKAVATSDGSLQQRNKQVVLDMWHDVIDGRNIAAVPRYIAENYVQHSASAGQGRTALMQFLKTEFPDAKPLARGTYKLTNFVFVLAEGDLVQLMFQRRIPSRNDPARLVDTWWYDTYRVRNGMIVEHWDSMQE
jgi:predicted SnoaL-like aldol condensation-catalyzing enzyme